MHVNYDDETYAAFLHGSVLRARRRPALVLRQTIIKRMTVTMATQTMISRASARTVLKRDVTATAAETIRVHHHHTEISLIIPLKNTWVYPNHPWKGFHNFMAWCN